MHNLSLRQNQLGSPLCQNSTPLVLVDVFGGADFFTKRPLIALLILLSLSISDSNNQVDSMEQTHGKYVDQKPTRRNS